MKYPRTYHLPWSPGATKDDKKLQGEWFDYFKDKYVVFTEKLDGENTAMTIQDVYARSHGAPTRSPWSRNLWDPQEGLYWKVKPYIGENEILFGENLYGEHSIHYNKLPEYWHMFAVNDSERWYSWDEVKEFANMIGVKYVPELLRTRITSPAHIKDIIDELMLSTSTYNTTQKEGIVMRINGEFPIDEFPHYVCKWVRPNHVQTNEHWTKNWKKAKLINNEYEK